MITVRRNYSVGAVFILAGIASSILYPLFSFPAKAASLTDVAVALSTETAEATGVGVTITFTPATAITNGSIIEVSYTGQTGGGSITDSDVSVAGTNITSSTESGFAVGYFRSVLSVTGTTTTTVTISIDNVPGLTNPVAGNYGWGIAVDIGGAGTTFDYGAGLAYVENDNDVTVTATVPSTIDMEIYQQNSETKTNSCALGVLSLAVVKSCVYDIAGATNSSAGMTVRIASDGLLNSGANDINNVADGTVSAGSEEYGIRITDDGTGDVWAGAGTFESADTAVPQVVTNFASTSAVLDGINTQGVRLEVTHRAAMATNTVIGSYDQLVTYTAFTN